MIFGFTAVNFCLDIFCGVLYNLYNKKRKTVGKNDKSGIMYAV